jgi:hypothetical protein
MRKPQGLASINVAGNVGQHVEHVVLPVHSVSSEPEPQSSEGARDRNLALLAEWTNHKCGEPGFYMSDARLAFLLNSVGADIANIDCGEPGFYMSDLRAAAEAEYTAVARMVAVRARTSVLQAVMLAWTSASCHKKGVK